MRSVLVMPPKNGIAAEAPQSRAGSSDDQVQHQRVAGLGALDVERPGLRVDEPQVDLRADRSSTLRRAPPNASSDHSRSAVPGWMRITGATPPKV